MTGIRQVFWQGRNTDSPRFAIEDVEPLFPASWAAISELLESGANPT